MKITAVTKYKHGEIFALLKKLGWTQSELGRRAKLHPSEIGLIINLRRRPSEKQANAIQRAFGESGEYLDVLEQWPETFKGIKKGFLLEQTADVDLGHLVGLEEALQIVAPESQDPELQSALEKSMEDLSPRERDVLEKQFLDNLSRTEVAKKYNVCPQAIANMEKAALRKLRKPSRIKRLLPFVDASPTDPSSQENPIHPLHLKYRGLAGPSW